MSVSVRTRLPAIDCRDHNAVGDCTQPSQTITVTSGSTAATLSSAVSGLKVGHTITIDSVGFYVVAAKNGTAVTLATPAAASGSGKKFIYGTDNTVALNAFFARCLTGSMGAIPSGRYGITDTVGVPEPGNASGNQGLCFLCGGAGINTMRLANMALSGGVTFVWMGAPGGTMVQFSRVLFVRIIGGLSLVGQASYDPSGVFTLFGPRAGIGLHLSQNSTPTVGTGYMTVDELVCGDMDLGVKFGTNLGDNNADTSIIHRLVLWRCSNGALIKHTQGLSYQFGWIHAVSVTGYVVKSEAGGAIEIGSLHLSACGTASADATVDTYGLDLASSLSGYVFKVGLMRLENGTVRAIALRSSVVHLQIGVFEEATSPSTDKTLFYLQGGTLQILGGRFASFFASGEKPFSLANDANAKAPRLLLRDLAMPTQDWNKLFTINANAVVDVSVMAPRNDNNVVGEDRHTRLERGRVVIGGNTADATTAIRLDPLMRLGGSAYVYSYGPRVPKGTSTIRVTLIGDHGNNTPSIFRRLYTLYRAGDGTCTVVDTRTIGTDVVVGTDQLFSFGVTETFFTLDLEVKGTAATTVNWRAVLELESVYAPIPDY